MKEIATRSEHPTLRPISWLIAIASLSLLSSVNAEAARIQTRTLSRAEIRDDAMWSNYLARGSYEWRTVAHPPVTASLEASVWRSLSSGTATQNAMVEFLLWRQSINAARFDHYHPRLAIAFKKLKTPTISSNIVTAPSLTTVTTPQVTPNIQPEAQLIPPVPEPSALWIGVGMVTWAAWTSRQRRRQ